MLTLLFIILMFMVFGKLLAFAIRAAWGITKIFFYILFLPIILLGMVFSGLLTLAFPILIVIGIIILITTLAGA